MPGGGIFFPSKHIPMNDNPPPQSHQIFTSKLLFHCNLRSHSNALSENYVYKAIDALPVTSHAVTQFATGVMALQLAMLGLGHNILQNRCTPWWSRPYMFVSSKFQGKHSGTTSNLRFLAPRYNRLLHGHFYK